MLFYTPKMPLLDKIFTAVASTLTLVMGIIHAANLQQLTFSLNMMLRIQRGESKKSLTENILNTLFYALWFTVVTV